MLLSKILVCCYVQPNHSEIVALALGVLCTEIARFVCNQGDSKLVYPLVTLYHLQMYECSFAAFGKSIWDEYNPWTVSYRIETLHDGFKLD